MSDDKTAIKVIEMTRDWKISVSERGVTGTRKFRYSTEEGFTGTEDIPKIGSLFTDNPAVAPYDLTSLTCRDIEAELIDGDKRNIFYICTYRNDPTDDAAYSEEEGGTTTSDPSTLPTYYECGGDFITKKIKPDTYKWSDADKTNVSGDESASFVASITTMRIKRVIVGSTSIDSFNDTSSFMAGSINDAVWNGYNPWVVQYQGYTGNVFTDYKGRRCLEAEMIFSVRRITFVDSDNADKPTDGWPYMWSEDLKDFFYMTNTAGDEEVNFEKGDFALLFSDSTQ